MENKPSFSVCICTYNRAASLRHTLDSMTSQSNVDWSTAEVLVIDNNCTDNTATVCAEFSATLPLRRIQEPMQGLSHARNRAVKEASGDWILFTDDDVLLDPNWLRAYGLAATRFPDAEFAGGRMVPHWTNGAPRWFKNERLELMDGLLGWFDLGGETRPFADSDPSPFGANFAIRRSLTERMQPFRSDLGVSGNQFGRGEETEYLGRVRAKGAMGIYVNDATVLHCTQPNRFRFIQLYKHGISVGQAHRVMTNPDAQGSPWRALMFLLRGMRQAAKGRGDRFRQCIINAGIQRGLNTATTAKPDNG